MQPLGLGPHSFTISYEGKADVLSSSVFIQAAFDPDYPPTDPPETFRSIWDTGATNSVINENVVTQCQLRSTGVTDAYTAQGRHRTETYLVGVTLPNRVTFPSLRVSKGFLHDFDVLIGMDIIGQGDFAVTNKDGNTVFSFRIPSLETIDFVTQTTNTSPI